MRRIAETVLTFVVALLVLSAPRSAGAQCEERCESSNVQERDNKTETAQHSSSRSGDSASTARAQSHDDDVDVFDNPEVDDDGVVRGDNDGTGRGNATDTAEETAEPEETDEPDNASAGVLHTPRAPRTPRSARDVPVVAAVAVRQRSEGGLPRTGADLIMYGTSALVLIGVGFSLMAIRARDRANLAVPAPWGDEPLIGW